LPTAQSHVSLRQPPAPLLSAAEIADPATQRSIRRAVEGVRFREPCLASPQRRTRRKLQQSDYEALGAFREALRRFLAFSEAGARATGLTPRQHQALLAIRAHPGPDPISVGDLAATLLIKNHSAVGLVDRLLAQGLITRAPSQRDRRRVILSLTSEGAKTLESISRNNLGKLKASLPVFTDLLQALEHLELPAAAPDARPGGAEDL
jgi:DNA-binding MarR family transcriptional regulator